MIEPINDAVKFRDDEPGPGEALEIEIERLPMSLNFWTRKFWTVRSRDARDTKVRILIAFGHKRRQWVHLNGPWFRVPVTVVLTYYVGEMVRDSRGRFVQQEVDVDNLVPKHIIDALKGLAFADDGPRYVRRTVQEVVLVEGKAARTNILIVPYEARSR